MINKEQNDKAQSQESENNQKKRKKENQWICPICFEKLRSPVVTPCGHVFCYDCIDRWLLKSDKCPICTSHVNRNDLIVVPGHGETNNIGTQERRDHSKWKIDDRPTRMQLFLFIVLLIIFAFLLIQ